MKPLRALLLLLFLLGLLLPRPAAASFSRPLPQLHPPVQSAVLPVPENQWPQARIALDFNELQRGPPNGLFCDNDPLNIYDPDGRVGKGIGGGVWKIGKSAGTTVWNVGGSLGYGVTGIYDAFAGTNNAEEIYGKQAQGLRDTAKGVGNLVWNTGGTIGYGVASGVDKFTGGNYAQETYGQQWAGMKQIGAAFTAEGQSGGYRVGYTATQLAAIILPVKGGSVLRAGEVGEVANVARVSARSAEFSGAPLIQGELKTSALLKSDLSTPIYRLAGGDAPVMGRSWTTLDPRSFPSIEAFKKAAGIGAWNTGETLVIGRLKTFDGAVGRTALPIEGVPHPWVPEIRLNGPAERFIEVIQTVPLK